ncbi:prephenate dehydrogenase/arogenate dehydrogenase family protein [Streptomyces sp. CHA1]|uniref:prephenate dehydrogenase/arogenate dehydrogenase family protein n=1 Tax=Streptomyces TaxID=1883 RepID=UPI001BFC9447|nr:MULTISPECIES: prephenate dehydrogenase/arogenate dehydrogenase family protein [unclassified Streptomyces]MBT3161251.1 prephenate dehydrogenase/arogenate dehydrogenase family protein [Streptomyces sp. G11C]MCO6704268.1 prephenate dehydrogenase/arogenate dehydrogenase family protein [Streptomyces sp. CHB9.2]MCO6710541.1 prephenate dehydrogenase/arogenate dehydrogenase family protein [Streptomyces sp. CHA3]MCO6716337.1 prephenate dehydrogenase/arogenate dehydrogenase family protein [Streptomyce
MRSALIVGTRCVGTSVALALRSAGVAVHLTDTDRHALRIAVALGAGTAEPPSGLPDVAVLAVPPDEVAPSLSRLQKSGAARSYTDVAGIKLRPQEDALRRSCDMSRYVGGHPMVDRAHAGPLAAREDLFRDCHWALTPTEAITDSRALNEVLEIVALCGATPVLVDAARHDDIVARTTQLPYLLEVLLAGRSAVRHPLADRRNRDPAHSAPVAAGSWGALLAGNAEAVLRHLKDLDADIHEAMAALESVTSTAADAERGTPALRRLHAILTRAADRPTPAPARAVGTVAVSVRDSPGELARLLADVAAAGVSVRDVAIEHGPDHVLGTAELLVAPDETAELTAALCTRGWAAELARSAPSRPMP